MLKKRLIAGVMACAMILGLRIGVGIISEKHGGISTQAYENTDYVYYDKQDGYLVRYVRKSSDNSWTLNGFYSDEDIIESSILNYKLSAEEKSTIESYSILTNINGAPVTSIDDSAFSNFSSLTSITFPENLKSINSHAFYKCSSLTNINIPNNVTIIGDGAFSGCSSLTSVTIPSSVTSIGDYTFSGCSFLTSITIPGSVTSIGTAPFYNCTSLTEIKVSGGSSYTAVNGVLLTADKKTLVAYPAGSTSTSFTVPDSVTSIGSYAIYGCNRMKSITIPANVKEIGYRAVGYTSAGQLIPGFVIYGNSGSAAEDYALANGLEFKEAGAQTPTEPEKPTQSGVVGDLNGDGLVNASDAAMILIYAAAVGAGYEGTLPEYFAK